MTILITGGKGILGNELRKLNYTNVYCPGKDELDITKNLEEFITKVSPDVIIHCAALTKPMNIHDKEPNTSIEVNIISTAKLAQLCNKFGIRLVYISTDYVYPGTVGDYKEIDPVLPINKYGWSKLGGECAVQLVEDFLILRCSHTERPFIHKKAFYDSIKNFIYVDDIAPIVMKLAVSDVCGVYNIGGKKQSIYEFAKTSNSNVERVSRKTIGSWIPENTSFNLDKLTSFLNENNTPI